MSTLPATLTSLAVVVACGAAPVSAGETATAAVSVNVQVASRTSLTVSSDVLHFAARTGAPATAAIEFNAGARVPRGADLVLTIEPQPGLEDGAAADVEAPVTFEGDGDGTVAGVLPNRGPVVAGRWQGSGNRRGRVRFTLHTSATGDYVLPVRFVLSTP